VGYFYLENSDKTVDMELLKKYKIILLIVIPVIILVLIRAFSTNHFMNDARKLAEPSYTGANIITPEKLSQLPGEKLLVILGKETKSITFQTDKRITISTDSIMVKENLRTLKNHEGLVLLWSSDNAVTVRIWMLLSQMGIRKLYILSEVSEPEVLKYEFRPDTTARPEL